MYTIQQNIHICVYRCIDIYTTPKNKKWEYEIECKIEVGVKCQRIILHYETHE